MKARERALALAFSFAGALSLASGCNSLIGADAPKLVDSFGGGGGTGGADASTQCLLNSECPKAEICVFRVCSQQCAEDKDCLLGRCLPTADGNACVVPSAATCSTVTDCPSGSQCLHGACRTACTKSGDCLTDQSCLSGACVGNDSTHDPSTSGGSGGASGGSAGHGGGGHANGGEAGMSTGGTVGEAGMGGEAGAAPQCTAGDVACLGLTPLSCQDGQMKANGANCKFACTGGACTGECTAGDKACDSNTFETCGNDNKWQKTPCQYVCDATNGCVGSCTENALQCSGTSELDVCSGGSYTKKQSCTNGECATVNGVAKCAACGDSDKICPPGCKDTTDVDCPKEPGETCTASTDCRVGVCGAEGVCCDSTCGDSCSSCKIAGKPGICTAIDYSQSSDLNNCGSCHGSCSTNHVTASCTQGTCGGSCTVGYASCNAASVNDGCETNITNDPNNCNSCGTVCKYGSCVSGACAFTKVGPGPDVDSAPLGSKGAASLFVMPLGTVSAGKVAALGLYAVVNASEPAVNAYLALYSNANGAPGALVAETNLLTTIDGATGATEGLINPPVTIAAGTYWLVLEMSSQLDIHTAVQTSTTGWFYNTSSFTFAKLTGALPGNVTSITLPRAIMYAIVTP